MIAAAGASSLAASGDDWLPVTSEELKMTSEAKAPGAPAINLYREVNSDDQAHKETVYVRIKILTEEGRKYGDVAIPMYKFDEQISNIRARTIRPDGSIVNFDGKVYLTPIIKARGLKIMTKSFTLPEVQVGSIIEYRYTSIWAYFPYGSHWILSDELFTARAKFTFKPNNYFAVKWISNLLPEGTNPPKDDKTVIWLESKNIPAFQSEDFMPPENELKSRVDFIYVSDIETDPEKFWKKQGKKYNEEIEIFIGKRKAMEGAVASIVSPNDSPETKIRKIYARVLQIHNNSMDAEKSDKEQKRDKQKEINNVEDVWKRGYGSDREIDYLFLALARAAGIEAYEVFLAPRDRYFFNPQLRNTGPLVEDVVLVKINGKEYFSDPGALYAPFGLLPWELTGVAGLRLDKEGGSWITTPMPDPEVSRVERKAELKATTEGSLEGKLTVRYTGLEAIWRRSSERQEDAASRKKFLEDQVREYIPATIDVELTNTPDWMNPEEPLVGEYDLKVPGWISGAGKRALLPVGLFSNAEKHIFEHADRVHPVYFTFPFRRVDDITIELPLDWKVGTVPAPQRNDGHIILYTLSVQNDKGTLHIERQLDMKTIGLEVKYYPPLRNFFRIVRSSDELQIVLQPGSASAGN